MDTGKERIKEIAFFDEEDMEIFQMSEFVCIKKS